MAVRMRPLAVFLLMLMSCAKEGVDTHQSSPSTRATPPARRDTQPLPNRDIALANRLISQDRAIVLDVRTEEEWKAARYEGALLIPHSELEARAREVIDAADGDLTRPVVIFCRSGRRADLARTVLEAQGFTRVTNAGGLVDLCPACMP